MIRPRIASAIGPPSNSWCHPSNEYWLQKIVDFLLHRISINSSRSLRSVSLVDLNRNSSRMTKSYFPSFFRYSLYFPWIRISSNLENSSGRRMYNYRFSISACVNAQCVWQPGLSASGGADKDHVQSFFEIFVRCQFFHLRSIQFSFRIIVDGFHACRRIIKMCIFYISLVVLCQVWGQSKFLFLTNPKKFVPLSIDYGSPSLRTHFLLLFKLPAFAAAWKAPSLS